MHKITLLLVILILFGCSIQNIKAQDYKSDTQKIIEENEKQLIHLENEIEKNKLNIAFLKENTGLSISSFEERVNTKIDKIDSKYNYYLIFGGAVIAILAFLINFFGRKLIRQRVEILINKTTIEYAQKTTNDVIQKYIESGKIDEVIVEKAQPAIEGIIKKLEFKGTNIIDGIKLKGDKAINSMLAKQDEFASENTDISTDEDIIKASKQSRSREFFELAYSRKDPLVQIELYKNVLEIEPENIEALNNISVSYNNAFNYQLAIETLEKAIEIAPNFSLAYANLGYSYNMLNDLDKAISYVNKAIEIDSKLDWSYTIKANILTKKGNHGVKIIWTMLIHILFITVNVSGRPYVTKLSI